MREMLKLKAATTKVDFLGQKNALAIRKLSGQEVLDFQAYLKANTSTDDAEKGLAVQFYLIRVAVEDAADMTDAELKQFPLDDISGLVEKILKNSGLDAGKAEGNA